MEKVRVELFDLWENREALEFSFPEPLFRIDGLQVRSSSNELQWQTTPGQTYHVEYSDDLQSWSSLTNSVVTAGARDWQLTFIDGPTNVAKRFYRLVVEP